MPSIFAALEDRAFKQLERVFGEPFEFRPFAAAPGGGRAGPDGTRAVRDVVGSHSTQAFKSTEFGKEARGSLPAAVRRVYLHFDERQFADGQPPRQHDRFKRKDTRELFEVSSVPEHDAEGRLKILVSTLGFEST